MVWEGGEVWCGEEERSCSVGRRRGVVMWKEEKL